MLDLNILEYTFGLDKTIMKINLPFIFKLLQKLLSFM